MGLHYLWHRWWFLEVKLKNTLILQISYSHQEPRVRNLPTWGSLIGLLWLILISIDTTDVQVIMITLSMYQYLKVFEGDLWYIGHIFNSISWIFSTSEPAKQSSMSPVTIRETWMSNLLAWASSGSTGHVFGHWNSCLISMSTDISSTILQAYSVLIHSSIFYYELQQVFLICKVNTFPLHTNPFPTLSRSL